jgi:beta-glucosidase
MTWISIASGVRCVIRVVRVIFDRLGLFDPPKRQRWLKLGMADVDTAESQQLNREASRQSLVLLQNRNRTLPFAIPTSGRVAVIGASGNSTRLLGGGHYARTLPIVDGFMTGGFPSIPVAIATLLRGAGSATVQYLPGISCTHQSDSVCTDPSPNTNLLLEAVAAARSAAQVVLVLNLQSRRMCISDADVANGGELNPCGYEAEQFDRSSTGVPRLQLELAKAVLTATTEAKVPTVVVLVHGGALAIEELVDVAPAILDAHYPGEATGATAVADTLYGLYVQWPFLPC